MGSLVNLLSYFRRYRGMAIASIAASSVFEIMDLLVPYCIGQILNVLSKQPLDRPLQNLVNHIGHLTNLAEGEFLALGVLVGLIFLVTVVRAPLQPWLGIWFHWLIAMATRRDQFQKAIAKILTLPLEFYDENNPGRIAGRLARGISNHTWTYPEVAGQFIPKMMRVVGIFVIICFIEWRIAIALLLSFIFILAITFQTLHRLIKREERIDEYMENTESRTSEIITNIKTVKAFATEAQELARQNRRLEREYKVVINRIHKGYTWLATKQRLFIQTSLFFVMGFSLMGTVHGLISIGHFVTVFTLASMGYAELEPISNLSEVFARRYASMIRYHEFMKQKEGLDAADLQGDSGSQPDYHFTGKIELINLTFGYNSQRPVLQDINLLIEPYQTVALVGRSGSGKSTLVKLLFRYFEPNQGQILIDGDDLRSLDITRYRKRLAIVHQEVDIFNGTLLDNLKYGNSQASFEEVEAACKMARVDEFIDLFPQGYYTIVGERGVRLSGGQRQRLGIARALIVNPDILVFDEATSSLDYESERAIQLAMSSIFGTRTTIIIAHRLSTVREADKIVVLDSGRIVEVGSHAQLLNQEGIYQRLHTLQETGELLV